MSWHAYLILQCFIFLQCLKQACQGRPILGMESMMRKQNTGQQCLWSTTAFFMGRRDPPDRTSEINLLPNFWRSTFTMQRAECRPFLQKRYACCTNIIMKIILWSWFGNQKAASSSVTGPFCTHGFDAIYPIVSLSPTYQLICAHDSHIIVVDSSFELSFPVAINAQTLV